jgi:hypothetical protein
LHCDREGKGSIQQTLMKRQHNITSNEIKILMDDDDDDDDDDYDTM